MLKIAKSRVGADFRYISDEYLIRPACQDFWRIEATDDDNYHVSRIVSSSEDKTVPEIVETASLKIAARVRPVIPLDYSPSSYESIGISPRDEFLIIDDRGATHELSKVVTGPHKLKIPIQLRPHLEALTSANSQSGSPFRKLVDFLVHHGPIKLDYHDAVWRRFVREGITGVTQLSKRPPDLQEDSQLSRHGVRIAECGHAIARCRCSHHGHVRLRAKGHCNSCGGSAGEIYPGYPKYTPAQISRMPQYD